ncbi:MAG: hypothetical protein JXA43_00890 [Candidatus Diapherotrites archaeon]|nr:hypothetical protein [Candidatus Diapherotrites archaeon]
MWLLVAILVLVFTLAVFAIFFAKPNKKIKRPYYHKGFSIGMIVGAIIMLIVSEVFGIHEAMYMFIIFVYPFGLLTGYAYEKWKK